MTFLLSLWLPILLSGVALFLASFLAWMILPHHKSDWKKLPDEDRFCGTLKNENISPGQYMFPYCADSETMKSPEFKEKMANGPSGVITVFPGQCNMGINMFCTFLFFLVTSFCIAYLATLAIEPGANFMRVFRFVGTAGILTYSAAGIPNAIWFKRKIAMDILDGIAYGLITGAIFGALWPGA